MKSLFAAALLLTVLPQGEEWIPKSSRTKIAAAADEVAKLGDGALLEEMERILVDVGVPSKEIETRRDKKWTRSMERASTPPKKGVRRSAGRKVQAAVKDLEARLDEAQTAVNIDRLSAMILALDSESVAAHESRGSTEIDGRYFDGEGAAIFRRQREVDVAIREAMALPVEFERVSPSPSDLVTALAGSQTHAVSAHGIRIHGGVSPDRLERALGQSLRALAFVSYLNGDGLEIPTFRPRLELYITNDIDEYEDAYELAKERGDIPEDSAAYENALEMAGFSTKRDVYVIRWEPESRISADVVWFAAARMYPRAIPPFLFAGPVNWVCLRFFGTTKPAVAWNDGEPEGQRTTADLRPDNDALWRAASSGLFGARSYLRRLIEDGEELSMLDTIVDQEGKLSGVPLLKATIVSEYLLFSDRFTEFLESKPPEELSPARKVEFVLGETIPQFDQKWHAFLLGGGGVPGVLQRVQGQDKKKAEKDPVGESALKYLVEIREQAFKPLGVFTEKVLLYPDLSANARRHAAYLQINEDQKQEWPDAHEEYAEREGFTPEGAWAGGHSVIAFDGDVEGSIDAWMATFYHRLPLLEPGLCGIGAALDQDVVLLDTGSLLNQFQGKAHVCWPHRNQKDVPLRFRPELPNPVPGEDQSEWGYPITIQSYWGQEGQDASVDMQLFVDGQDDPVDCHYLTPSESTQTRSKPKDAYCLIPKKHLKANTTYRVKAQVSGDEASFSWTFKTGSKTY